MTGTDQMVTVDAGELLEALQAATAWAGFLRQQVTRKHAQETADRIDQSVHKLNVQLWDSLQAKREGVAV